MATKTMKLEIHISIDYETREQDQAFVDTVKQALLNEARSLGKEVDMTSGLSGGRRVVSFTVKNEDREINE